MATTYKTSNDWTSSFIKKSMTSKASGWASAGMTLGSFGGFGGAVIGAMAGWAIGSIVNVLMGNGEEIDEYQNTAMQARKETTRERNKYIYQAKNYINSTRSSFDSTYGNGMFDQYDDIFMQILGMEGSTSLADLLSNMQMDKVSGVINSKVSNLIGEDILTASLSVKGLQNISNEYYNYIQEQLRAQDTTFGIQMQSASESERYAYNSYYQSVGQLNLQYAQQFESAFMQYRQENIEGEQAMGNASLSQATSGIRQEGSGTSLTSMQQFQNDLARVAQSSVLKKQMQMMGYDMQSATDSVIYNSYSTRQTIRQSTSTAMSQLINSYNTYHSDAGGAYTEIVDREQAVEELNKGIEESEKARTGINNHTDYSNLTHTEEMETYF